MMRLVIVLAAIMAACQAAPLAAQGYPARPIRIVVPTSPGGATDAAARLIGPKLTDAFGQTVIVENKIGAGGSVGADSVAKAAPDGCTLLAAFDNFTSNPYLFKATAPDPVRNFAPISLPVRGPQVLAVHPKLNVHGIGEFLRVARAKGASLNYATAGAGTSSRLTVELVKVIAGIDPTAVHYKGGSPAMVALLSGEVDMMIVAMGTVIQHLRTGKLTALAVTSARRSAQLPDVPTLAESYPGFESHAWVGLLAPAATPREIIVRLNAEVIRALAAAEVKERFEGLGYEIAAGTPEAFSELIRVESAKWEKVIRERQIAIE